MKRLMCLNLQIIESATETSILPPGLQIEEPHDWREEAKKLAKINDWDLRERDLQDVRSLCDFLIRNKSSIFNPEEYACRKIHGGAVIIDSIKGKIGFPCVMLWEEDIPEPKLASTLPDFVEKVGKEVFEELERMENQ